MYTSYIQSFNTGHKPGFEQILTLSPSWWAMYHADFDLMEKEIIDYVARHKARSRNMHAYVLDLVNNGERLEKLTLPKSIIILKKILLIRACSRSSIKVNGVIDRTFFFVACCEDTKQNRYTLQKFEINHLKNNNKGFYTVFRLEKFSKNITRRDCPSLGRDLTKSLCFSPMFRFAIAGVKKLIEPIKTNAYPSTYPVMFVVAVKNMIMSHKGMAKLAIGQNSLLLWRVEIKKGFSLALFNGLQKTPRALKEEWGVRSSDFFMIECERASFVYKPDEGEISQMTKDVFTALRVNGVILDITLMKFEKFSSLKNQYHEVGKLTFQDEYLQDARHTLNDYCYDNLKRKWALQPVNQILRRASFGSGDKPHMGYTVMDFNRVDPKFMNLVVQKLVAEKKISSHDSRNNALHGFSLDNATLLFNEKKLTFSSLHSDVRLFNVCIDIISTTQLRSAHADINAICSRLVQRPMRNIMKKFFDFLFEAASHDDDFTAIRTRAFILKNSRLQPYDRVVFKKASKEEFNIKVRGATVIVDISADDFEILDCMLDVLAFLNWIHQFSMEHVAMITENFESYVTNVCRIDVENFMILVVMLRYQSIIAWLKWQIFGGEFDHYAVIKKDLEMQMPLFTQQKKLLRMNRKIFTEAGYSGDIEYVTSLSGVFGEKK